MRALLLVLMVVAACKPGTVVPPQPPQRVPVVRPVAPVAAPPVVEDASWLQGTWAKEGKPEWLLFNPPHEVAVLRGTPATMEERGSFIAHGRFIAVLLPSGELDLKADEDRKWLLSSSPQAKYSRGSPP